MTDPESSFASAWHLDVLSRRRAILLWTTLGVFIAAAAFIVGLPDVYRTSSTLLVEGGMSDLGESELGGDPGSRLQVIKQEALGRAQLGELLARFDLYDVSEGGRSHEQAIQQLRRDITVEPLRDQMITGTEPIAFQVSYVGRDPQRAADVTNAIAAFFVEQNDEHRSDQSSRAVEIEAEIAATRLRLDEQEAQVRGYSRRNLGALPQQVESNLAAIARLDAQLRMNGAEQLRLMERRQVALAELATIASQAPTDNDATLSGQLRRLEAERAEMRTRFEDDYPDVRAVEARIRTVRAAIAAQGQTRAGAAGPVDEPSRADAQTRAIAEIDGQLSRLAEEDRQLRERISGYERRVESVPANAPAFDRLMGEYQATRDRLDALQRRYDEARLTVRAEHGGVAEQFRILDAALPPGAPAGPSRMLLAVLGVGLALACGIGAAFVVDRSDTSFHSVDDLRAFADVPILASIPDIAPDKPMTRRVREAALAGAGVVLIAALASGAFYVAQAGDQISRALSRVL